MAWTLLLIVLLVVLLVIAMAAYYAGIAVLGAARASLLDASQPVVAVVVAGSGWTSAS